MERETEPGRYPHYVLGVLVLVYVLNFVDRQILSILNEEIKRDLRLGDAQMGFLYGTAFAVFYALFGIPLGRLADVWVRRSLIALSLTVWSTMTALSGLARSFPELAAARFGVGVGEAGASPAAFSLLSDYYPSARRATALALYSSGIYLGAGLGLMIGGQVVHRWDGAFAAGTAPFGLRGWQVAFFAVGLPGLALALWVRSLREPRRGAADGIATAPGPPPAPVAELARELAAVIPPFGIARLASAGAGRRRIAANVGAALALAAAGAALVRATGDTAQWTALAIGLYAAVTWAQSLALRDRPAAALILGTPSLRWTGVGLALLAFTGYGVGYWTTPFFLRVHHLPIERAGLALGGTAAAAGWLGIALGGILGDAWRRRDPRGRLLVAIAAAALPLPILPWMLTTTDTGLAIALNFPLAAAGSMWIGVGAATVQDLVLPRMRATASAAYLLVNAFIGLAMGPYTIGHLSDTLGLRTALLLALLANAGALLCLVLAARTLAADEKSLRDRAHAAGEPIA
ncbi:MAG TPA: MFS transporter [Myxococcota bacterium]|nr:MFS transporter [Myxococcota bacterium]